MQNIHEEKAGPASPPPPARLGASDLRRAYHRDQLELVFQPTVELESGQVWSLEALVRWQHPEQGLLLPHQFLGLAPPDLALELNRWVFLEAGHQLSTLEDELAEAGEYRLTVNLFTGDFLPAFLEELPQLEQMAGWPLERVELDCPLALSPAWLERLDRLAQWRVRGSLEGIHQLQDFTNLSFSSSPPPVEVWKIENSTLHQLGQRSDRWEKLEGQILHARSLGLVVLARGVESLHQAARLQEIGCQVGQGFCFARPTQLSALGPWLESGASLYPHG